MQMSSLAKDEVPKIRGLKAEGEQMVEEAKALDAMQILSAQHREVEDLFHRIETGSDKNKKAKEALVREIAAKLTIHAKIEEKVFYPGVKKLDEDLILEAFEEHEAAKFALRRALGADAGAQDFKAKITLLKELIQHHVKEEETELFPKVRKELSTEALAHLTEKVQSALEREVAAASATPAPTPRRAPAKRAAQTRRKATAAKATAKPKMKAKAKPQMKAKATKAKTRRKA